MAYPRKAVIPPRRTQPESVVQVYPGESIKKAAKEIPQKVHDITKPSPTTPAVQRNYTPYKPRQPFAVKS